MKLRTLLLLGRTSNLPTVWSNVLCGAVLSGAPLDARPLIVLLVAGSCFYEGGMFLNDAFDAEIDARERPGRPIPAGLVARGTVFSIGFGLLGAGVALLLIGALLRLTFPSLAASAAGLGTAAMVLIYNKWHKGHAWSPLAMGACRAGLYLTAAFAVSGVASRSVLSAALALLAYIVGLTHIARFETGKVLDRAWPTAFVLTPLLWAAPRLWATRSALGAVCFVLSLGWSLRSLSFALRGGRMISRAVLTLIAGVSLVDALFMSLIEPPALLWVLLAGAAFLITVRWQRSIPGT